MTSGLAYPLSERTPRPTSILLVDCRGVSALRVREHPLVGFRYPSHPDEHSLSDRLLRDGEAGLMSGLGR